MSTAYELQYLQLHADRKIAKVRERFYYALIAPVQRRVMIEVACDCALQEIHEMAVKAMARVDEILGMNSLTSTKGD